MPPSAVAASSGRSRRQRSSTHGQRGWNAQPPGGCSGFGTSPATGVRAHPVMATSGIASSNMREIKVAVTQQAEAVIPADAIFASNTSTLPITGLATASSRPASFIGLHFFSPAEKMPLVEIIVGKATSDATLARSMDYVRAIGKTPIVVNDSRGFYTSRVFGTYVSEGMALLEEGVPPALIDRAGLMAGMPVGPLGSARSIEGMPTMYALWPFTSAAW